LENIDTVGKGKRRMERRETKKQGPTGERRINRRETEKQGPTVENKRRVGNKN
jgi:hypothetical protein